MTPTHLLVDAFIAGAAALQRPTIAQPIHAAYAALTHHLQQTYPTVDLTRVQQQPDSPRGRAYLHEDLTNANAAADPALLETVYALITALLQHDNAAAIAVGVDLQQVKAAYLQIHQVQSSGVGTRVRDSEFTAGMTIGTVQTGGDHPSPTAAPAANQLIGNVAREIHIGPKTYIGADDGALDLDELEQSYLRGLYAECNELPLASDSPPDAAQPRRPRLQRVYVDLHTTAPPTPSQVQARLQTQGVDLLQLQQRIFQLVKTDVEPRQPSKGKGRLSPALMEPHTDDPAQLTTPVWLRALTQLAGQSPEDTAKQLQLQPATLTAALAPLSALESICATPQLVILGDPGSGKSTLTRRLAALLAASACGLAAGAGDDDDVPFARWLLPVRVVLSRWANHLAADASGAADDLIQECVRLLGETAKLPGASQTGHFLARLTATPPTALILLDGLDEVVDAGQRYRLLKAVRDFCQHYAAVPLLVTCRIRPYTHWQHNGEALPLPAFTLAPLTDQAIRSFVQRWHAELTWAGLYQPQPAQQAQQRLLTALADPTRRDLHAMAGAPLLLTMMARINYTKGLPDSRAALYEEYLRQLLWEWERHKLDDRGQLTSLEILLRAGGVSQVSLERALSQLAYQVHGQQQNRDTVDIPRSQVRTALERIHPGDEDAKAVWALQALRLIDDRSGLLYTLDQESCQFAHRTLQEYLAARWLATGDFLAKFRAKIDQEPWREALFLALGFQVSVQSEYDNALCVLHELLPEQPNRPAEWRQVLLLGAAYVRLLGPQRVREAEQQRRAREVMRNVPERLTAALHNPDLPAPQRLEAGLLLADLAIQPPGLDDFVTAPDWPFQIARYPVTNGQYRRFIEAGGYASKNAKRWWSKEGREYKKQFDWTVPRLWDDPAFNRATQPVVGVSWYEAEAYCAWLTHELPQTGAIRAKEEVRLPTAAQWEQAARSHDDRPYPWGKTFITTHANTKESGLKQTTPVHMYPQGVTPAGVWDLCGNVWEWIADDESYSKGIRGGAYWNDAQTVGSAARLRLNPHLWDHDVGFRCVVVPISRSSF
jgi:hypothetical protein